MKPKEHTTLSVKYRRGYMLPVTQNMDHLHKSCLIKEVELREAGEVDRDGKKYEFQVVRLLIEVLP